ncbi:MAG: M48 family metallopeptidase [Gammaproteobacteria bacterium]
MSSQLSLFEQTSKALPLEAEDWRVRVSQRARNLSIQVYPHGAVEIVVPKRTSAKSITAFVASQKEWIVRTRDGFAQKLGQQVSLPDHVELKGIGQRVSVHYEHADDPAYSTIDQQLTIRAPQLTPTHCWPLMQQWVIQLAKEHLGQAVERLSAEVGARPARVQVRLQKTRWGSCSHRRTLSLNAGLLLVEPEQLEYVVIHELCHLHHMNHSKRYWKRVKQHCPKYRTLDRSLEQAWQIVPSWLYL